MEGTNVEPGAFQSSLKVLMQHLLKYEYEPWRQGSSWLRSIKKSQKDLKDMSERKSLMGKVNSDDFLNQTYKLAKNKAEKETEGKIKFPKEKPEEFTLDNLLDKEYVKNFLQKNVQTDEMKKLIDTDDYFK